MFWNKDIFVARKKKEWNSGKMFKKTKLPEDYNKYKKSLNRVEKKLIKNYKFSWKYYFAA